MSYEELFAYTKEVERWILAYIEESDVKDYFKPEDIYESVMDYPFRPAKRMRPSMLLIACGSVGGEERIRAAVPAAAGVELFHTWTLVHDDLIDNDPLRRGKPTVHEAMFEKARKKSGFDEKKAKDYGRDIAVLTGDLQHGWCSSAFIDCALSPDVDTETVLRIMRYLQSTVLGQLVRGEVLDIQYGMMENQDIDKINQNQIVTMLWLKTGVLFEFSGMAGALIGKNAPDFDDEQVQAVKKFAGACGTAFQLQDDVIGIVGDEKTLGKPVGSDIREGKKTVVVYESLKNADESQRQTILAALGNKKATKEQVEKCKRLFVELDGINETKKMAESYINKAMPYLNALQNSKYKKLLTLWAEFMINREY